MTDDREIGLEDLKVLTLLATGLSLVSVAQRLELSGRTVRRRTCALCDRFGVGTPIEAIVWAAARPALIVGRLHTPSVPRTRRVGSRLLSLTRVPDVDARPPRAQTLLNISTTSLELNNVKPVPGRSTDSRAAVVTCWTATATRATTCAGSCPTRQRPTPATKSPPPAPSSSPPTAASPTPSTPQGFGPANQEAAARPPSTRPPAKRHPDKLPATCPWGRSDPAAGCWRPKPNC